jgi:hypothetical protein
VVKLGVKKVKRLIIWDGGSICQIKPKRATVLFLHLFTHLNTAQVSPPRRLCFK